MAVSLIFQSLILNLIVSLNCGWILLVLVIHVLMEIKDLLLKNVLNDLLGTEIASDFGMITGWLLSR